MIDTVVVRTVVGRVRAKAGARSVHSHVQAVLVSPCEALVRNVGPTWRMRVAGPIRDGWYDYSEGACNGAERSDDDSHAVRPSSSRGGNVKKTAIARRARRAIGNRHTVLLTARPRRHDFPPPPPPWRWPAMRCFEACRASSCGGDRAACETRGRGTVCLVFAKSTVSDTGVPAGRVWWVHPTETVSNGLSSALSSVITRSCIVIRFQHRTRNQCMSQFTLKNACLRRLAC